MYCPLCGAEEEAVAHFVTECAMLEEVRERFKESRRKCWRKYCCSERTQKRKWRGASHCSRRCGGGEEEKWIDKCWDLHISSASK